ncbi:hypothetical protein KCU61_g268, partial [Aureobasidium melanogenum]
MWMFSSLPAGRRCLGGGVASFVTFPSAVRAGKVDLLFYFDLCRFGDGITPIRGREDCTIGKRPRWI